jgi:7,8-dihydropterin-6-yl-methyl-4-(beta-D-ribofuranosyl)aminobenzene 5'-phosphate synthase
MIVTEVERLKIVVITDNYYDALRPDPPVGIRYRAAPGRSVHAEHGLSYFIETTVDGTTSRFMFDYGLDPRGVLNNMALLGIDLAGISAFGLSHGHFDHWGSLLEILKTNQSRIVKERPFYVGKEVFAHRYGQTPNSSELRDLSRLDRGKLEALGLLEIVEIEAPTEVVPGGYLTGEIEKTVDYEKLSPALFIERDGRIEVDDFRGEEALFFNVKGKGLVVLSGCAHVGIVNTVMHALNFTGTNKVHAVMGGFHLVNADHDRITQTVDAMKQIGPDHIIPAHCTGFDAIVSFSREMPNQFSLNTAGATYTF